MMIRLKQLTWVAGALSIGMLAVATNLSAQPLHAYVPNANDGTISAIDLATDRVEWTLKIGERAAHGIAASPDGRTIYAGDPDAKEVVVIDAGRQTVIKRISVPFPVHGIDISPDGKMLWAGGEIDMDPFRGTLALIDTQTLVVEDVISPTLGAASHFAVTPDSKEAWIASTSTNLVWIVDAGTRRVSAVIPVLLPESKQRPAPGDEWNEYLAKGQLIGLNEIAIAPDGDMAYAVGPAASELFAIDVKQRQVVNSVHAGERAHGVTVRPNGKEVWVADWAGVVSIFDAATLAPLDRIPVASQDGTNPRGANHIAFTPDGERVYVTSRDEVVVLGSDSRKLVGRMPVGAEPHEISLEDWIAPERLGNTDLPNAQSRVAAPSEVRVAQEAMAQDDLTRTSNARAVTVEVTPLNLGQGSGTLDFQVALETHSIDLDYDFASISVLRDDAGNDYRAAAWEGPRGGHHLSGVLRFAGAQQIMASSPRQLELRIHGVAGMDRSFRWDMAQ